MPSPPKNDAFYYFENTFKIYNITFKNTFEIYKYFPDPHFGHFQPFQKCSKVRGPSCLKCSGHFSLWTLSDTFLTFESAESAESDMCISSDA
jgi:hypothetical protein